jgi:hypothetical protein
MAKQQGHDVTAISVDTGFLSDAALINMLYVPEKLKIDHIILRCKERFRAIYREKIPEIGNYPFNICGACHEQIDKMVVECAKLYGCTQVWSGMSPDEESLFPKGILKDQCGDCEFKTLGCCGKVRCAMASKFITQMLTCPLQKWLEPITDGRQFTIDDFRSVTGMRTPLCEPGFVYDACAIVAAIHDAGLRVETSPLKTNCRINYTIINNYMRVHGVNPYMEFFASQPKVARKLKWTTWIAKHTGAMKRLSDQVEREVYAE